MCPHFDNNARKCKLYPQEAWSLDIIAFGLDFMLENFCFAPEYIPDKGQGDGGFSTCGMYKHKSGESS
jgi:hypothetical protein